MFVDEVDIHVTAGHGGRVKFEDHGARGRVISVHPVEA